MEAMRESWTDARLDDFRGDVDRRFDEVGNRFDRVDAELREQRREMVALRAEMNERFGVQQRLILQVGGGMFATMVVGFASLIVTQV